MEKKLSVFTSLLSSLLLVFGIAAYRKIFTFNQLCNMSGGPEIGLNTCPSFLQVFTVTLVSPLGLTVLFVGTAVVYTALQKLN